MGSDDQELNRQRRYDITMSRRTRRPSSVKVVDENGNSHEEKRSNIIKEEPDIDPRRSLKQLITDEEDKGGGGGGEEGKRSSLGQRLNDEPSENQLKIVVKQQESLHGMKLKKMVSRYAKVLGHLMMMKNREPSQKRAIIRLSS